MSSKPQQTTYNTRLHTRARASSVSIPAHEKNVKIRAKRPDELTKEQKKVVSEAEQQLTEDECTRVNQREYSVRHNRGNDMESPGEGPSKGKGPDTQNWGAMNLEDEELDMEAQYAALESYKLAKQMASESESEDPSGDEPGNP
ncbi:uncharacterized protein EDB91DRAFT_1251169 [Suillus paluster]|uniref:uncharacterized protein n=1 Tax=Suillus paluster TaxID=48578 RepID=UPI001B88438B|nr:uncharacterized protein EDB91DRAFT_1251169 [Suillus paluster]KAG1733866.1 hypothetical protein EDB91DRAFT_1251169 [Suillus paluster]